MWAYFNSWDSESGDTNNTATTCIVVPTTRELDQEEEKKLVKYFNQSGWKCLPPGLPYVEGGKIYALNAQAMLTKTLNFCQLP